MIEFNTIFFFIAATQRDAGFPREILAQKKKNKKEGVVRKLIALIRPWRQSVGDCDTRQ
jgi:hypothetical protein